MAIVPTWRSREPSHVCTTDLQGPHVQCSNSQWFDGDRVRSNSTALFGRHITESTVPSEYFNRSSSPHWHFLRSSLLCGCIPNALCLARYRHNSSSVCWYRQNAQDAHRDFGRESSIQWFVQQTNRSHGLATSLHRLSAFGDCGHSENTDRNYRHFERSF
jgi:hypothetical protein